MADHPGSEHPLKLASSEAGHIIRNLSLSVGKEQKGGLGGAVGRGVACGGGVLLGSNFKLLSFSVPTDKRILLLLYYNHGFKGV